MLWLGRDQLVGALKKAGWIAPPLKTSRSLAAPRRGNKLELRQRTKEERRLNMSGADEVPTSRRTTLARDVSMRLRLTEKYPHQRPQSAQSIYGPISSMDYVDLLMVVVAADCFREFQDAAHGPMLS